jgi:hypothetical protein
MAITSEAQDISLTAALEGLHTIAFITQPVKSNALSTLASTCDTQVTTTTSASQT